MDEKVENQEVEIQEVSEPETAKLDAEEIERAVLGEHIPAGDTAEPEPEPPGPPASELWAMLWQVGCSVMAGRRGDHWQLTNEEAQALGAVTEPVADKWLPDFEKGPEAALIITAAMVFAPRAATDARQRKQRSPDPEPVVE